VIPVWAGVLIVAGVAAVVSSLTKRDESASVKDKPEVEVNPPAPKPADTALTVPADDQPEPETVARAEDRTISSD